ncbi:unnamed protein product [Paramecium sonneborni]|uniref:WD40-repeat-containing domain n=1 Tax=Paramecium sonneborni TaxID=65129 RepID=A0A8S1NMU3_9CILI|nr:unnamed protein product [Paramecium sonneborni]
MIKQYNDENQTQQTKKSNKYELIYGCTIKQYQWCGAISFSSDNERVVIGCKNKLKIYQFSSQMLKLLQTYNCHTLDVNTINIFKKPNNMISGSEDKQMILWSLINGNSKKYINKQKGKDSQILSVILNEREDQIISGSSNIKIWKLQNGWSCLQTISDHKDFVWALCINQNGNQLLSTGYDKLLIIFQLIKDINQNKKWIQIQKIEGDGFRLCWINDQLFTFQKYCKEQLSLYQKYNSSQNFRKIKNIYINNNSTQCYGFFPQKYIKEKNILVNKNGRTVNILSKQENEDFILDQAIQFNDYYIQGNLSDDGEYLITWEGGKKGSFEIQIRKYQVI